MLVSYRTLVDLSFLEIQQLDVVVDCRNDEVLATEIIKKFIQHYFDFEHSHEPQIQNCMNYIKTTGCDEKPIEKLFKECFANLSSFHESLRIS